MFDMKSKILLADDMSTMRKSVCKFLKELRYTVFTETVDGKDALLKVKAANPLFNKDNLKAKLELTYKKVTAKKSA